MEKVALEVPVNGKSFAQLEADLARINVMRLRGDIQTAKHLCAELLAQKPDFAQAQALMGDLCMDSDEYLKAADWYEMAAANSDESPTLHHRAELARRRVDEVEALAATKRLGIPTSRNKLNFFAGLLLTMVLAVCGMAFYVGGQLGNKEATKVINRPLNLSPQPGPSPKEAPPAAPAFSLPAGDERVFNSLKGSALGSRVLLAYRDPRGPTLVVSVEAPAGEFTKTAIALDAAQFLRDDPSLDRVVVRFLRGGETLAIGTLTRKSYDSAVAESKDLGQALEDVWPSVEPEGKPPSVRSEQAPTQPATSHGTEPSSGP